MKQNEQNPNQPGRKDQSRTDRPGQQGKEPQRAAPQEQGREQKRSDPGQDRNRR